MTADAGTSVHTAEPEQAAGDGRQWAARRSRRAPGEGAARSGAAGGNRRVLRPSGGGSRIGG